MKTKNILALALFTVLIIGLWQFRVWREKEMVKSFGGYELPDLSDKRTPEDKHRDKFKALQSEAEAMLMGRITNTVGYRRHTSYHLLNYDSDPNKWSAIVTVETVNRLGGVEAEFRTYRFLQSDHGLIIQADPLLTSRVPN